MCMIRSRLSMLFFRFRFLFLFLFLSRTGTFSRRIGFWEVWYYSLTSLYNSVIQQGDGPYIIVRSINPFQIRTFGSFSFVFFFGFCIGIWVTIYRLLGSIIIIGRVLRFCGFLMFFFLGRFYLNKDDKYLYTGVYTNKKQETTLK